MGKYLKITGYAEQQVSFTKKKSNRKYAIGDINIIRFRNFAIQNSTESGFSSVQDIKLEDREYYIKTIENCWNLKKVSKQYID